MLKRNWKRIGMIILIVACIFNVMGKLINKLSLKDLKDLKTNIEREKEFGFVYGQPKQENSFVKGLNL